MSKYTMSNDETAKACLRRLAVSGAPRPGTGEFEDWLEYNEDPEIQQDANYLLSRLLGDYLDRYTTKSDGIEWN